LDAAESVADADLDTLQSLVDKSLLRHRNERFWMLETIREFALERLENSGEKEDVMFRQAAFVETIVASGALLYGDSPTPFGCRGSIWKTRTFALR
jgi:hypothetical protein